MPIVDALAGLKARAALQSRSRARTLAGARWVDPVTVAEVEFTDWMHGRRVRHPSLKGIREDKEAREVTIERPAQSGRR